LADKLSTLTTEKLNGFKLNAEKAAIELTAERNKEKLEEIIASLLGPN